MLNVSVSLLGPMLLGRVFCGLLDAFVFVLAIPWSLWVQESFVLCLPGIEAQAASLPLITPSAAPLRSGVQAVKGCPISHKKRRPKRDGVFYACKPESDRERAACLGGPCVFYFRQRVFSVAQNDAMAVIHTGGRRKEASRPLQGPDNHSKGGQAASDHASHQGDDQLGHAPGGESQVEIVYSQESQHDCQQAGR